MAELSCKIILKRFPFSTTQRVYIVHENRTQKISLEKDIIALPFQSNGSARSIPSINVVS